MSNISTLLSGFIPSFEVVAVPPINTSLLLMTTAAKFARGVGTVTGSSPHEHNVTSEPTSVVQRRCQSRNFRHERKATEPHKKDKQAKKEGKPRESKAEARNRRCGIEGNRRTTGATTAKTSLARKTARTRQAQHGWSRASLISPKSTNQDAKKKSSWSASMFP